LLESQYRAYSQQVSDFDVFVFSDHGHVPAKKRLDIHNVFRQQGSNLRHFIHLIESNYARFWFRNKGERATVERILSTVRECFILTEEHLRRYRVEMPDNRYGDLIFYLDAPFLFAKTIWGFSRGQKSMHGYLPDYLDSDGVFLSQRPLVEGTHVELVDVLPTLLDSLGLPIPDYVDGRVLWHR